MRKVRSWKRQTALPGSRELLAVVLAVACGQPVVAEIIFDGTLGPAGSQSGDMVVLESMGSRAGANLFHSFEVLNVNPGETLTFRSAFSGVTDNVVSRVTGGSLSLIDGLLSSEIAGADFWLINPAGVVFGADAALDVLGSVNISTGDYILFEDGERFSATNPTSGILSVTNPAGFGFLNDNPAGISLGNSDLQLADDLTLVSGPLQVANAGLSMNGANLTAIAVGGAGEVLDSGSSVSGYADVTVQASEITSGGGRVFIRGDGFVVSDGSIINSTVTDGADAGDIHLVANNLSLTDSEVLSSTEGTAGSASILFDVSDALDSVGSSVLSQATPTASGDVGGLFINTQSFRMELGFMGVLADGQSSSGSLTLNAAESVTLEGGFGTALFSNALGANSSGDVVINTPSMTMLGGSVQAVALGTGAGGSIAVNANALDMSGGAQLSASTRSAGDAGDIAVQADSVVISGGSPLGFFSGIAASAPFGSTGNAGNVTIDTRTLEVSDGAFVSAFTGFVGQGGTVTIDASESVLIGGVPNQLIGQQPIFGGVFANTFGTGDAGGVFITTPDLRLTSAGGIQSASFLNFQGFTGGDGGTIDLDVGTLTIESGQNDFSAVGTLITAGSFGSGSGGDIFIDADLINMSGGLGNLDGILNQANAEGNGGNLFINTTDLNINEGALLSASSFGSGNAGRIEIVAAGDVTMNAIDDFQTGIFNTTFFSGDAGGISLSARSINVSGMSSIQAATGFGSSGNGGSIDISAGDLAIVDGGAISASSFGTGNAGSVAVSASGQVDLQGRGQLATLGSSTAGPGSGGAVRIEAGSLALSAGAAISVSTSGAGDAGVIDIAVADELTVTGTDMESGEPSIIESRSTAATAGAAGSIFIDAGSLALAEGGQISASTSSDRTTNAPADISLSVGGLLSIEGIGQQEGASGIFAQTSGAAAAGTVSLNAGELELHQTGIIRTDTLGAGAGGPIQINADTILLDSESTINAGAAGAGTGGMIAIEAGSITITNAASVESESSGTGNAGNLALGGGTLELSGGARLATNAQNSAGGEIDLQFTDQVYLLDSTISAAANGVTPDADGGNVSIDPQFVVLNRSRVLANANAGNGGNILISGDYIFVDAESVVDASSRTGVSGDVRFESPNDVAETVLEIQAPAFDEDELVRSTCVQRALQGRSSLIVERARPGPMRLDGYLDMPMTIGTDAASSGAGC